MVSCYAHSCELHDSSESTPVIVLVAGLVGSVGSWILILILLELGQYLYLRKAADYGEKWRLLKRYRWFYRSVGVGGVVASVFFWFQEDYSNSM